MKFKNSAAFVTLLLFVFGLNAHAPAQDCHQRLDGRSDIHAQFGTATAIEGNTLIVGARTESDIGAVHIYREDPATLAYRHVTRLLGSDSVDDDLFGHALALDGDRLVVGAPGAEGGISNPGQVYVFERTPGTDAWVEQAILSPAASGSEPGFGFSIALDGDRLAIVGNRGASVYCFELDSLSGQWVETQALPITGVTNFPDFESLAMSGDRLLAGIPRAYANSLWGMAVMYTLDPVSGLWVEQTRLFPGSSPNVFTRFGQAVALQGDRAVVSYPLRNSGGAQYSGGAHVLEWNAALGTWGLAQILEPSVPTAGAWMGSLVTLDGDLICLGAPMHPLPGTARRGVIHRFRRGPASGFWTEDLIIPLPMDFSPSDFPWSLELDGEKIAAGGTFEAMVHRPDSPDCNNNGIGDLCEVSAGTVADVNRNFVPDDCEPLGFSYCGPGTPNSTGVPSETTAVGNGLTNDLDFTLLTTNVPNNQFAYYLVSMGTTVVQQPGGSQGDLCIAGSAIGRFNQTENILSGVGNRVMLDVDLSQLPQPSGPIAALAGETWYFQLWHRDMVGVSTSNFSDARGITFQ